MPRKRVKKAKVEDPETDAKLAALSILLDTFRQHASEHEEYIKTKFVELNEQITKMYQEKLQAIPEHIRKMTVSQIMELEAKNGNNSDTTPDQNETALRNEYERHKQATEKKKTLKKEKKRSLTASSATRALTIGREPLANNVRISRTLSESSVFTPARQPRLPSLVVTPKFNPKLPVSRMARKPRADELVMSLSGSPVQYFVNDEVSLSLGGGKIITFDDKGVLNKDFIKQLDDPIKKKLEEVKNQLDKILQY